MKTPLQVSDPITHTHKLTRAHTRARARTHTKRETKTLRNFTRTREISKPRLSPTHVCVVWLLIESSPSRQIPSKKKVPQRPLRPRHHQRKAGASSEQGRLIFSCKAANKAGVIIDISSAQGAIAIEISTAQGAIATFLRLPSDVGSGADDLRQILYL